MSRRRLANIVPISSPALNGVVFGCRMESANAGVAPAAASTGANTDKVTTIHVTALDSIVSVNSLFTMSLFIGLTMTVPENATTVRDSSCTTGPETVRRLIVYEVVSFSFFLFSSLIAQSLKLTINLSKTDDPQKANIGVTHLKYCLFASAMGSVLGCTFLVLSIVDFIRVKLGSLSCGGKPVYAVAALSVLVGSALVIYVITAALAAYSVEGQVDKYEVEMEEAIGAAAAASVQQNQTAS